MSILEAYGLLLMFIALFIIINDRFLKMPEPIGITLMAVFVSILCIFLDYTGIMVIDHSQIAILTSEVFSQFVLKGVLIFLLFAGSLHVNVRTLKKEASLIFGLSTIGVITATLIYGFLSYILLALIGIHISFITALLLGAVISPTDPIAVMSILKSSGLTNKLETLINGESLFNDGIGYTLYIVLLEINLSKGSMGGTGLFNTIVFEVIGGLTVGLVMGLVFGHLLRWVKKGSSGIMITLSALTTILIFSNRLSFSGPLAAVAFGIYVNAQRKHIRILEADRSEFFVFWSVLDTLMNSMLFLLIGLQVAVIKYDSILLIGSLMVIVVGLISRFMSVYLPLVIFRGKKKIGIRNFKTSLLLTWGGLRGGLSLALVMTLPHAITQGYFIPLTYAIVIFSIVVQGLTVGKLYNKIMAH